jgi:peroxiredoxin
MPYIWLQTLLGVLAWVAIAGAVILAVIAVFRGKGRRKRPLLGAIYCLGTFVVLVIAFYSLVYLVYLRPMALEAERERQEHEERIDAASVVHVGDPAPAFTITDTHGAEFVLDDLSGKVVLVKFFATWCGNCLKEMPHLQKIWDDNRDNGALALIVIGREETDESVIAYQAKHGYSFPMASDPERSVYSFYATKYIPRTYLVSPDGRIRFASTGLSEDKMTQLQSELAKQLRSTP